MAPKKRSNQTTTLEDVVDGPVVTKKSRKGQLDKPVVESTSRDELFKRRQAAKGLSTDLPDNKQNDKQDPKSKADDSKGSKQESAPSTSGIWVNRAPVLTLWVAVVAQRQGFSRDSGLTFGKAIAGLLAQSKGRAIGVYEEKKKSGHGKSEKQEEEEEEEEAGIEKVHVFGMAIKGLKDSKGDLQAVDHGTTPVKPASVQGYLSKAFGPRLDDAETALQQLADAYKEDEIGGEAYRLYEAFRPSVPSGQAGWGRKGLLELERLQELRP